MQENYYNPHEYDLKKYERDWIISRVKAEEINPILEIMKSQQDAIASLNNTISMLLNKTLELEKQVKDLDWLKHVLEAGEE